MTWSIDPNSARVICTQTDEAVDGLNPIAETVSAAFDAVHAAGGSETASASLEVSMDPFLLELHAIREFVKAATSATRNAITAYESGDLEMAADFQKEASGVL